MGKTSDLGAFHRGQIVGARYIGHSISAIARELGFQGRQYSEYTVNTLKMEKNSDRANCKGQLALNKRGARLLSRIVRSQTLAQITTQPNQGASRTVSKRTVQRSFHRMGFGSRRPMRVPLLNTRHRAARLAWAREHREWTLEDWKRAAWSEESRFRLLHAYAQIAILVCSNLALQICNKFDMTRVQA
ncbi:hypothetical protein AVEN_101819-1 [Araneus ventricosus]|uniref:Transposase Tc1-like domain-containing protein n=1 Tax=Araneus ventricosus TaxID=182803 RepID=A0A4Y2CZ73_ARAVE|nr:hypothetical protein AVEN_101819-1 [Araneus ventricosus]